MPFGKHKGKDLEDIPEPYLTWVLDHCELKSASLETEIKRVLGLVPRIDFFMQPSLQELKPIYRRMASKYHPDRGGSTEAMIAVNDFWEQISKLLQQPPSHDFFN